MERNKIIAVAALAAGIIAWRMGAMQQEMPENVIKVRFGDDVVLDVPIEKARLFNCFDAMLRQPYKEAQERAVTLPEISSALFQDLLNDLDWVEQVRNQRKPNESEQQAAERIVRTMPAVAFNKDLTTVLGSQLMAADYLQQSALRERYACTIARMLVDPAALRLLYDNDHDYIAFIQRIEPLTQEGLSPAEQSEYAQKRNAGPFHVYAKIIDKYLPKISNELLLKGHRMGVVSAMFSPNGSKVVTASVDYTARIWNAQTGVPEHVLQGHTAGVRSAVFSPDGSKIVTASEDHTACIWNVQTGMREHELKEHTAGVRSAVFSPDGSKIVTASEDNTARIWNAQTGIREHVLRGHRNFVNSAVFCPDGSKVVTASWDHTARIWNAQTGIREHVLQGHAHFVNSAVFCPDGSKVVTASFDTTACIWNAQTGRPEHLLRGHESKVNSAVFSPDGSKIVTASCDKTACTWNAQTGGREHILRGHKSTVDSAVFSPDGSKVVTASDDYTARIWNAQTGEQEYVLGGYAGIVRSAMFSPDGSKVVTASIDTTARIWEIAFMSFDQTLYVELLRWAKANGRDTAFPAGWARDVINTLSPENRALIQRLFP